MDSIIMCVLRWYLITDINIRVHKFRYITVYKHHQNISEYKFKQYLLSFYSYVFVAEKRNEL